MVVFEWILFAGLFIVGFVTWSGWMFRLGYHTGTEQLIKTITQTKKELSGAYLSMEGFD